ncbi:MAG: hypothetical protein AAF004_13985 [Pseudomonadota bacterium]
MTIAAFNYFYYQFFEYSFMHLDVVDEEVFNAAPARDGHVPVYSSVFSQFSYAALLPISQVTFDRFFNLRATGDALTDAVAASKKTRQLYRHAQMGELYPFIPDQSIERASRRAVVCGSYARTTLAALEHMGHVGRVVYLNGHVTMEVHDFDTGKWIYVDPNYGTHFTGPDGNVLSITEFQSRLRASQTFAIHSMDNSDDDPHLMHGEPHAGYVRTESLKKYVDELKRDPDTPYFNGLTAFEDGYGYNYRRKALVFARRPAHVVVLRDERMSPTVHLGGVTIVSAINALLFAAFAAWILGGKRREAQSPGT